MQVILLERVGRLGQMGDEVTVKDGFARNYLLPQGKALRATKTNRERFERDRAQLEARNLELRSEAEKVAERLEGQSFIVIRQAGDTGQLYGSVSTRDIAGAVTEGGFSVERHQVLLPVSSPQGAFPIEQEGAVVVPNPSILLHKLERSDKERHPFLREWIHEDERLRVCTHWRREGSLRPYDKVYLLPADQRILRFALKCRVNIVHKALTPFLLLDDVWLDRSYGDGRALYCA